LVYQIGVAATLCDIGKTSISEELLNKREKLNKKEQKTTLPIPQKEQATHSV